MTVDRNTRKQAKKNWKKHAKRAEENGPKRERIKKKGTRRLCKGMCYSAPVVTTAERTEQWEHDEDAPDTVGRMSQLCS